jgi:hypothetical protein
LLLPKILGHRRLAAFSAAFFIGLLAANLAFILFVDSGIGLNQILNGGESSGVVIMDEWSRSIYTSRIPLSIALSLNKIAAVQAEPLILSICRSENSTIIIRGIQSPTTLRSSLISGTLPDSDGPWIVLGKRAAERIHAKIGQTIPIAGSIGRTVMLLTVAAICDFPDARNDEGFAYERLARQLSSIQTGMISAAIVRGMDRERVEQLLKKSYKLNLKCFSELSGNVVVLEPTGAPIRSSPITRRLDESFELPFGYYTVVFQSPHLSSTLGAFLLSSDQTVEYNVMAEQNPVLRVPSQTKPILRRLDGVEVNGVVEEGVWTFRSLPGMHTLQIDLKSYSLPLYQSATFDPSILAAKTYKTRFSASWIDGSSASEYTLVIKTETGKVVLSLPVAGTDAELDLPAGNYIAEAYKLPYSGQRSISIPAVGDVQLIIPGMRLNMEKIPIQYYTLIKAMPVESISTLTLASISGLSASLLTGLAASIMLLFLSVLVNIQKHLYLSSRKRLTVLSLLGASKRFIFKNVELPISIIALSMSIAAALISSLSLFSPITSLTLFGHSIPRNPTTALFFSLGLAVSAAVYGHLTLARTIEM